MAYYIGHEKEFTGQLPFSLVVSVAAVCMLGSEIVAMVKKRKRKIGQTNSNNVQGNQGKKMVISNLIPFTKLNLTFAFSALITCIIRIFQRTQIGVPYLSIQLVVMFLCLLGTNNEAKIHFKRKSGVWRGVVDIEANLAKKSTRKRDTAVIESNPKQIFQFPENDSLQACCNPTDTTFPHAESQTLTHVNEITQKQDICLSMPRENTNNSTNI